MKKYLTKNQYYSCRTHWDSSFVRLNNPNSKIYMIWEIIRDDFFNDNYSLKKENIIFVGGRNPLKGLKELLEAFNNSIQKLGYKLIILGECDSNDIRHIINKKNLINIDINNISCHGRLSSREMINAYKNSFCLVHPTYIDNSPNSVCEAQLSGLPVIASNVGGVSSLIEHNKTGILIDTSSKSIEQAVKKLHENENLRNYISENSRHVARKRHDVELIVKNTISMYKEIISLEKLN